MDRKALSILLVLAVLGQGCGTIIHGTRQNVQIDSNPPDAMVTVDGIKSRTPTTMSLERKKEYVVTVEKEGYEKGQARITKSFNGVATILGNILWLLPGLIVDFVAGGAWTLEPEAVNVNLEKKE